MKFKKNWKQNKRIIKVKNIEEKMKQFFQKHPQNVLQNNSHKEAKKKQEEIKALPTKIIIKRSGGTITT